jgi:hypothetical protein
VVLKHESDVKFAFIIRIVFGVRNMVLFICSTIHIARCVAINIILSCVNFCTVHGNSSRKCDANLSMMCATKSREMTYYIME